MLLSYRWGRTMALWMGVPRREATACLPACHQALAPSETARHMLCVRDWRHHPQGVQRRVGKKAEGMSLNAKYPSLASQLLHFHLHNQLTALIPPVIVPPVKHRRSMRSVGMLHELSMPLLSLCKACRHLYAAHTGMLRSDKPLPLVHFPTASVAVTCYSFN